jgi:hypothetical protein
MPGYWKKTSNSKYNNVRVKYNGIKFDSIAERDCYLYYELIRRSGEIGPITCQPKIYLTEAKILYKPDFTFTDLKLGRQVWVDCKGARTDVFQIKKRLWEYYGPGRLILVHGYGLNIRILETIDSKGEVWSKNQALEE